MIAYVDCFDKSFSLSLNMEDVSTSVIEMIECQIILR